MTLVAVLVGCNRQNSPSGSPAEDKEAKTMLQGVWIESETGEVSLRVEGDSIFYADTTSMPTSFKIVDDSLVLASGTKYAIVKQTAHLFWLNNQNGDVVKYEKSEDPADETSLIRELRTNATAETNDAGDPTGYYHAMSGTEITVKLKPSWNLRFINLPIGSEFTVTETAKTDYTFLFLTIIHHII